MTVRGKLMAAMSALIVTMSLLFVLVTHFVVKASLAYMELGDGGQQAAQEWAERFAAAYEKGGRSWEGIGQSSDIRSMLQHAPDVSVLLAAPDRRTIFRAGDAHDDALTYLGQRVAVRADGETVAWLHYYDPDAAALARLRIGIGSSVGFLLTAAAVVLAIASLAAAFVLSHRITAPLRRLIPAIRRLGGGELGIQAEVTSKDEFGTIARTFNQMSSQLQRAEQVRRHLVADVAHELRTPLTIVRGQLELLQQKGRPVEPESLLPLQDELIRLTRLVEELHQLSLAEARKLPLHRKRTDMRRLLESIVNRVSPEAEARRLQLSLTCSAAPPEAYVDPHRMTQVMLNLTINAIRYTPEGGSVRIAIEDAMPDEQSRGRPPRRLRITVSDTGQGIAPEQLPFIFERFYRTDEARSRHSGGTGLGLAIAKEFVVAHGGTIEAVSALGRGSSFIVELPAEQPE